MKKNLNKNEIKLVKACRKYKQKLTNILNSASNGKLKCDHFLCVGDIVDHINLCNRHIKNPNISQLDCDVCDLDTASRENLPTSIYNLSENDVEANEF